MTSEVQTEMIFFTIYIYKFEDKIGFLQKCWSYENQKKGDNMEHKVYNPKIILLLKKVNIIENKFQYKIPINITLFTIKNKN